MNKRTKTLTEAALIAALYIVLTFVSQLIGLASGPVQFRISEALTILPLLTSSSIYGLTIGCALANLLTGCALWDIVFGSLSTLFAAILTYYVGKKKPGLGPVFPVTINTLIIPFILMFVYGSEGSYPYFMLTVGIGEVVTAGILGWILYKGLKKTNIF